MTPDQRQSENQRIFSQFCIGEADGTDVPLVNYKNEAVLRAASRLSTLEYNAFYFYSGPARAYGLKTKEFDLYRDYQKNNFTWIESGADVPKEVKKRIEKGELQLISTEKKKRVWYDPRNKSKPKDVTDPAHALLVQLCGEFRDRATMIEAKINWYGRIIELPAKEISFDPKKDLWSQFSAHDYTPFLQQTAQLWNAKREFQQAIQNKTARTLAPQQEGVDLGPLVELLNAGRWVQIGSETHDVPVPAMTICETKYLHAEFVRKSRSPWTGSIGSDMESYIAGLAKFQRQNCSASDVAYYYDFRGDSNIKHYSPESNGMIWHASSMGANCASTERARSQQTGEVKVQDQDCENYFRRPFSSRWNAARAGLAAWLTYDPGNESSFRNDSSMVAIFPFEKGRRYVDPSREPYAYLFQLETSEVPDLSRGLASSWSGLQGAFGLSSLGLTEMADYKSEDGRFFVFNRLRNAVNRHTNWYQSGFNDGRGLVRGQAYSPFVASSYEPHESNAFTAPGYTVQGDADGRKYLMYVFRVPIANWVHSLTVKSGGAINFDTAWLDETSLGDTSLAEKEKAFDRLGTALEGEFDSILYLHNIEHETNQVSRSEAPLVIER